MTLELFLAELEKGVEDLNLGHFLRFKTGTDRIPLLGFKKISKFLLLEIMRFPVRQLVVYCCEYQNMLLQKC